MRLIPGIVSLRRSVAIGLCIAASTIHAQAPAPTLLDSLRTQLDRAVASSDSTALAESEKLLDRALLVYPSDAHLSHYRGYAAYRHALQSFTNGNKAEAGRHLDRAMTLLATSAKTLAWPETFMLQASVAGLQIAVDPSRGMELSNVIGALTGRAMQIGADNPRVLLLQAYSAQNTPPEYGGGVDKAKALVQRAMTRFAGDHPPALAPSWGREEATKLAQRLGAIPGH